MWSKKKKNNTYGNTFYREAMAGGIEKEPYTIRKLGKQAFKFAKWGTFAFLAVTAIWGCVDGFMIHTKPELSKGMELYSNHDDVLPNIYATLPETGYRMMGPEINPLIFDEEFEPISNLESLSEKEKNRLYIRRDSKINAQWIKSQKVYWNARKDDGKINDIENIMQSLKLSDDDFTNDHTAAKTGTRILPINVYNNYYSVFYSEFKKYKDGDENATKEKWKELLNKQNLEAPKIFDQEHYSDKLWNAKNPIDETYSNKHFSKESTFINLTELNNAMKFVDFTEYHEILKEMKIIDNSDPTYEQYREFQESRVLPSYMKGITTFDGSFKNLMYLDYMGGKDIYVNDFGSKVTSIEETNYKTTEINAEGLKYFSGAKFIADPEYDSEINDDDYGNRWIKNTIQYVVEESSDEGIKDINNSTNQKAYGQLNLSQWNEYNYNSITKFIQPGKKYDDSWTGQFIYRKDALEAATNYLSFLNGVEYTVTDTAELIWGKDNALNNAKEWVKEGNVILSEVVNYSAGDEELKKQHDFDNLELDEKYHVNFYELLNKNLSDAQNDGNKKVTYYENSKLVFGTWYTPFTSTIKKGFQVVPSDETLEYAKYDRGNDWYKQKSNTELRSVDDKKILNAGWTFMDYEGDLIRFYYEDKPDDVSNIKDRKSYEQYKNKSPLDYDLDDLDDEIRKAGLTAKTLTPGMGQFSLNEWSKAGMNSIDTLVDSVRGSPTSQQTPTPFTFTEYSEINIGKDNDGNELKLITSAYAPFVGFGEYDESALNIYADWDSKYKWNNGFDNVNEGITAAGHSSYNNDHYAIASWGDAWTKTNSPFYGIFVYPLSRISMVVQSMFPESMGIWGIIIGIFIIVFGLRLLAIAFSWGSTKKQTKMQELQFQVSKINAKYAAHEDNKAMKRRKQMEIMALYRKHNVNPMGSIGSIFTTLPVFLAIWTIINSIFIYKIATVGTISLAVSPLSGIMMLGSTAGVFIPIAAAIISVQIISAKLPQWLSQKRQGIRHLDEQTKEAMKKQNKTTTIMVVVFVIMGLTVPTLLGIYWMYSGMFTISQQLVTHGVAQRRARMSGIEIQEKEWITKIKQKIEAFKNWKFWDKEVIPTRK